MTRQRKSDGKVFKGDYPAFQIFPIIYCTLALARSLDTIWVKKKQVMQIIIRIENLQERDEADFSSNFLINQILHDHKVISVQKSAFIFHFEVAK